MVQVMDINNVSRQIVMAALLPGMAGSADRPGNDELALELASKYPGRFFPLVGMQRPELTGVSKWLNPDKAVQTIITETEEKLATGRFRGIGEVIVKHFAYSSGRHAELDNPIYSPFMQRLSQVAAVLTCLSSSTWRAHRSLSRTSPVCFEKTPRSATSGRTTAVAARHPSSEPCLGNHPNLYCDLSSMTNVGKSGYGIAGADGGVHRADREGRGAVSKMREVYEAFPDRFMIGMDVAHAPGMNPRTTAAGSTLRELLAQLKPQTAVAFAEGNAIRIFKLDR